MDTQRCEWAAACPFFTDPVGYSPEMIRVTLKRYCGGEHQSCARYIGRLVLGPENIPDSMLPGDFTYLETLIADRPGADA